MERAGRIRSAERAKPTSTAAGIQISNLLSACNADKGDMKGDFHEEIASLSRQSGFLKISGTTGSLSRILRQLATYKHRLRGPLS